MNYEPGQVVSTIESKKGTVVLTIPHENDSRDFMKFFNSIGETEYIHSSLKFKNVEEAKKRVRKLINRTKKGNSLNVFGRVNGEFILSAGIIKKRSQKGKQTAEVGMSIKKGYRHIGIGGKMMDFFMEKARENGIKVLYGRFFHENFDSLVLCKSRKLEVYRVDKNSSPHEKKWQKDYTKWDKHFDRVNARIFIE